MIQKNGLLIVAAIVSLLLVSQSALAQPGRGGPGGGGPGGGGGFNNDISLLGSEGIQKELDLSEDQVKEISEIRDESRAMMTEMFSGFRDIPREERREKMEEMREEMQEKMKEISEKADNILLETQKERLSQIKNQMSGRRQRGGGNSGGGLLSDDIAEKLGLSEEQKEEIREKSEKAQAKMREKIAEMQKEAQEELLKILDADQRKQYEEMFGEPFDVASAFQRGRGRGDDQEGGNDRGRGGRDRPDADDSEDE